MFKKSDKVTLFYYEGNDQVEAGGWTIVDYNDGLLKVKRGGTSVTLNKKKMLDIPETVSVFNMRSIGFLRAELEK